MWSLPKIVGVVVLALLLLGGSGVLIAYWYYNQTVNYAPVTTTPTPQISTASPTPTPQALVIGSIRQESSKVIEYSNSGYKPNYVYIYINNGGQVFALKGSPTLVTINGIGTINVDGANISDITSKSSRFIYGNTHFDLQNPYQISFINNQVNMTAGDYAVFSDQYSNKLEIYVFSGQITVAGQTFSNHQLVTITQTSITATKNAPTPSWTL